MMPAVSVRKDWYYTCVYYVYNSMTRGLKCAPFRVRRRVKGSVDRIMASGVEMQYMVLVRATGKSS